MDGALWYLKRFDLFERLTASEAERLNRRALIRPYKRHSLIYSPAEPGQSVLAVASGRVKIKDLTADGRETILAFIEEGELFGELALLDGRPRQEFAEAVEDSEIVAFPTDEVTRLMESRPDVALSVTKLIGLRRQRIESRLRNLLFLPSRARLVHVLLELAETHGDQSDNRSLIRIPLTHHDLAGLIGASRETVTIVLGQLQADRLVRMERKRILLPDLKKLREESRGGSPPLTGKVPRRLPPSLPPV